MAPSPLDCTCGTKPRQCWFQKYTGYNAVALEEPISLTVPVDLEDADTKVDRLWEDSCESELQWHESVYDEAFIAPLVRGQVNNGFDWQLPFGNMVTTAILLGLNMLCQGVVVCKVLQLSNASLAKTEGNLWEVCEPVSATSLNFPKRLGKTEPSGKYHDCGPLSLSLMTLVRRLDLNQDGFWTLDEAGRLQDEWEFKTSREASMRNIFDAYLEYAQAGGMRAQKYINGYQYSNLTSKFTAIPMAWLHEEQPLIELCEAGEPHVCGNFEVRNILESRLPDIGRPDKRVQKCEEITGPYCSRIFGERYQLYAQRTSQLCGLPQVIWDAGKRVRMTVYSNSYKYVNEKDGVISIAYFSFLLVILCIWFLHMLQELRAVIIWWTVVLNMPTEAPQGVPLFEINDKGGLKINAIPSLHKYITLVINLFPRTVLWGALSVVGSEFLIRADDYTYLILNSVALGFLIQIDEMLFHAVVATGLQSFVRNSETFKITIHASHVFSWLEELSVGPTFLYTMLTCTVSVGFMWHSYFRDEGKLSVGFGLDCICMVEGTGCMGAQVLGGLPSISAVVF